MAQKTNLNVGPYYDDFDPDKNYYKVLFKPGYPIQARELTTVQSIFQHQLESFGNNIFKDGSVVIPGSITYDNKYYSVKINDQHLGVSLSLYVKELVGKKIKGENTGVEAIVVNYDIPPSNEVETTTLYVKYTSSGNDLEKVTFEDGEALIILENISYSGVSINSGETIASTISENSCSVGSAVLLEKGVYFIRGFFVDVEKSTVILSPYTNITNYRVGLSIFEELVSSSDDISLNDNAKGFSNYAAPGADRFRIRTSLTKKPLDNFDDKNFIELVKIVDGDVKKLQAASEYSIIKDYIAKRTYEESGDYTINDFSVEAQECLNDQISNNGIYLSSQITQAGSTPSDNLFCLKVSPGKAYVRGKDIQILSTAIIDVPKPRETAQRNNVLVPFEMGTILRVNNVFGSPYVGSSGNYNIINLFNQRKDSNTSGTGTLVGRARIYSYNLSDASYSNNSSIWDLYLFDVQLYTTLTLNETLNASQCPATSVVRGLSSGAFGYVVSQASGSTINLSQISGEFISGEQISINESTSVSRSIVSIKSYKVEDVKSVYQDTSSFGIGISADFVADTVLKRFIPPTFSITDTLSITPSGGVSLATCAGRTFTGIATNTIIRYQKPGISTETYNRISAISADGRTLTLEAIPSVSEVSDGSLPNTQLDVTFSLGVSDFKDESKSSLYFPLPNVNISSVDISKTSLNIVSQVRNVTTDEIGTLTLTSTQTGITSAFFVPYDNQKYSVIYSDGTIEPLKTDQFDLNVDSSELTIRGLKPSESNIVLNASLRKVQAQSASKTFVKSQQLVVDKTNSGVTTSSGLTTSPYYGLRIEDQEISLNVPDVVNVVAVYESINSSAPILDKLEVVDALSLNTNSFIGENIVGETSKSVAQLVTRDSSTQVGFVYLNSKTFVPGELVRFKESGLVSTIKTITKGNYLDITDRFVLDKGHRNQYCDYSRIVRKSNSSSPSKQLLVIFNYYDVSSNNGGDIVTANSYGIERYKNDIPLLPDGTRCTDVIDFRPRVVNFSGGASPFDFSSRQFSTSTFSSLLTPNDSSIFGYSYYLPRIDKVYLNSEGALYALPGVSSDTPKEPANNDPAIELATIIMPPYVYNVNDIKITLKDNRRYTMRDIGKLEDRIGNLELVTSLSLLEVDTKSLQIKDANGFSRFKTGFFVDDFSSDNFISKNSDVKVDIDEDKKELSAATDYWSLKGELALDLDTDTTRIDYSENILLLDTNVTKNGDLITLAYDQIDWIEQPLASNVENVNPFSITEYAGLITLTPSADNWVRNIYKPDNTRVSTTGAIGRFKYLEGVRTSGDIDIYMRSRNVEFSCRGIKPLTQHYFSLDDITSTDIIPKLLEIRMTTGIFSVGETVEGFIGSQKVISFRLASPNHKSGPYNAPTLIFSANPYDRQSSFESTYSASSPILNIDTKSLAEESLSTFGGYVEVGTTLVGKTSKATAVVSTIRLVTDNYGDLIGAFFVRDPNSSPTPLVRIPNGVKQIRVSSSDSPSTEIPGGITLLSNAYGTYSSSGIVITQESSYVDVRNPLPPPPPAPLPPPGPKPQKAPQPSTPATQIYNPPPAPVQPIPAPAIPSVPPTVPSNPTKPKNPVSKTLKSNIFDYLNYYQLKNAQKSSTTPPSSEGSFGLATAPFTTTKKDGVVTRDFSKNSVKSFNIPESFNVSQYKLTNDKFTKEYKGDKYVYNSGSKKWVCKNDPLAQTFNTGNTAGFFTSVDVYFATKDPVEDIEIQLRTVELGVPTLQLVTEYSTVKYNPEQINTSDDASIPTNISFKSPIYLQPDTEYALVFLSPRTDKYQMWVGTMNQKTINTKNLPDIESVLVTRQYLGGSLFKSQNGSIWTASQYQDLKFKIYRAEFTTESGEVTFYNPKISADASEAILPKLRENAIKVLPRKLKVGITTTNTLNNILTIGRKVSEGPNTASPGPTGRIENIGGPLVSDSSGVTIVNFGTGYSTGSFSDVELYPISGSGNGAKANLVFSATGELSTISIASTGNGYAVGDVLGITTSSVIKGSGARISINSISFIDTLYLTNVKGEDFSLNSNLLYYGGVSEGTVTDSGVDIRTSSSVISPIYSGNIFEVSQPNHSMHGNGNKVVITNVEPDTILTKTTSDFNIGASTINVLDSTSFETFEGNSVSIGYLKINNEVVEYVSASNNVITISQRGVDGTAIRNHASGSVIQKYEVSGVSLRRINTTLDLPSVSTNPELKSYIEMDKYYLAFDRTGRSSGDSQLSFTEERSVGGKSISASQNYQFSYFKPQVNFITPGFETEIESYLRTVSGTSASGSETSFVDQGFESIKLNDVNYLPTPRLVCSDINESVRLTSLPKNKSLTLKLVLRRPESDSSISPVVDVQNVMMILGRNRLNSPISNYALDNRINLNSGDPHSSIYISNKIDLAQPASSLKLIISACRPAGANFRAMYRLYRPGVSLSEPSFVLFPGYDNLKDENDDGFGDKIINPAFNSGLPDAYVRESQQNEFLEYQFTADELGNFNAFDIKIVMTSTNESSELRFKDLRVIALA